MFILLLTYTKPLEEVDALMVLLRDFLLSERDEILDNGIRLNAVGNLGGYAGPSMMGWLKETTGGYGPGMLVLAGGLVVLAAVVASLRLPHARPN